jgi:DeoR/GlpR family transcriptional regulator of sugar metabolism
VTTINNPREQDIVRLLNEHTTLTIEELAKFLKVSGVTVRRDLTELQLKGSIVRNRGRASLPGLGIEPLFNQRLKQNVELKQKIAAYAVEQIKEGEVIALDVGTTVAELAKELLKKKNITVFTFSIQAASILARGNLNVYLMGGNLRKSEMSLVGSITLETIMKFHFDRFYMGLSGVSKTYGPTDFNLEEVEIKKALIERSKKVIALVDKTKIGVSSVIKVCEFDKIDEIITNKEEEEAIYKEFPLSDRWIFV